MAEWTEDRMLEVIKTVVERATTDPQYRAQLLDAPARAIHELTGAAVPDTFRLQIVDQSAADLTVVLPQPNAPDELTDSELEAVAGGKSMNVGPGPISIGPISIFQHLGIGVAIPTMDPFPFNKDM